MYENYWGLSLKPFENTPDYRFMYPSVQHEEALMRMLYSIREGKQLGLFAGEYGSGKTLLSRVMLRELNRDDTFKTVLIQNPLITPAEFLNEVLFQLGERVDDEDKTQLTRHLERCLKDYLVRGKKVVLIVDEAQVMEESQFEQLRLLLNFQLENHFLFTLLLLGQSDVMRKVDRIEPVRQRVSIRYHLNAMSRDETKEYVLHRLSVAGRIEELYTEEALNLIYHASQGIPRRINNICDHTLLLGYSDRLSLIGIDIVEAAVIDLGERLPSRLSNPLSTSTSDSSETLTAEDTSLNENEDSNGQDFRTDEEDGQGAETAETC